MMTVMVTMHELHRSTVYDITHHHSLFALHPINVESVAWISERKNLLSTLFFLLALGAYRWYAREPRVTRYAAVAALFALGLMAKPQVITFPFVLLLWDYWPLRRMFADRTEASSENLAAIPAKSFSWLILEKLPLFAICVASAVITLRAERTGGTLSGIYFHPFSVRLQNAILSYVRYVGKAFWPSGLALYYPYPSGDSLALWRVIAAGVFLVAVTAAGHCGPAAALSVGRVVLVSGDPGAHDRAYASGYPGDGRSLCVPVIHRPVHHGLLGRSGVGEAAAHFQRNLGRRQCHCAAGPGSCDSPPDLLLGRQCHAVVACGRRSPGTTTWRRTIWVER